MTPGWGLESLRDGELSGFGKGAAFNEADIKPYICVYMREIKAQAN